MNIISAKDWVEKFSKDQNYELFDIREAYETVESKLKVKNFPMAELAENPTLLNADKQCVIMCNSGKRATALVNLLETDFKMNNLSVLEGGYTALEPFL